MDAKKNLKHEKWMKYLQWAFIFFLFFALAYYIISENHVTPNDTNPDVFSSYENRGQLKQNTAFSDTLKEAIIHLFKQYGIAIIISFVTLVLSVISIFSGVALRIFYNKKIALEYLGWGTFICCCFEYFQLRFSTVFFDNPLAALNTLTYLLILMPMPFLFFINHVQKYRHQKLCFITVLGINIEFIVFGATNLLGIKLNKYGFILIMVLMLFPCIATLISFYMDIRNGKIKEYLLVAIGILCVWIVSFFKVLKYLYNIKALSDTLLPLGLILLLLVAAINTGREIIEMEKDRQLAFSASEAKGKFLANMSHEIRTPINAVLGMDAMILRECHDAKIKEYALDIQNAGQTLLSLINDILDFSKIESGKLEILPEEYDLSSLIHDIMNMITMKANDKDLKVNLSIDNKLPSKLYGDDVRIRQVLVNLMNNAVKYTEKGSVTLTVKQIEPHNPLADSDKASYITLFFQVEDTGIGIKEEDLSKLFAEFERIEEERNRNIEGTGLGMSITTQLLEMMDSKLQVTSIYGEGSKFFFTLTQRIMDAEPIGNLEERIRKQATNYSYNVTFTAPDAQILVVDDNAVNRKVFCNLLKETKLQIDEAAGGMECIQKANQKHYDLIFLDHMMPDLNGIDTLKKMRQDNNCQCLDTPVIALTANAISGAKEMYLSHGFDSFLSKPIIPEKLEKMLTDLLPDDKIIYAKTPVTATEENTKQEKAEDVSDGNSFLQELPQIDGIDWDFALLHMSNREVLADTIKNFYQTMDGEARELSSFLNSIMTDGNSHEDKDAHIGDRLHADKNANDAIYQYEVKVHSMKSNAAMIGAVSLSGVAKLLEYAAKDGDVQTLIAVTPVFLDSWKKLAQLLSPYFDSTNGTEKNIADMGWLTEKLDLTADAMNDMDIDTADESVRQIMDFSYPEALMPLIEKLNLSVANIDTEQTLATVDEIKAEIKKMDIS